MRIDGVAVWVTLAACPVCRARPGKQCTDMQTGDPVNNPHRTRHNTNVLDGCMGKSNGNIYIETYATGDRESFFVEASSVKAAINKLCRKLGVKVGTVTTEK